MRAALRSAGASRLAHRFLQGRDELLPAGQQYAAAYAAEAYEEMAVLYGALVIKTRGMIAWLRDLNATLAIAAASTPPINPAQRPAGSTAPAHRAGS